jgi:hypothetical protein
VSYFRNRARGKNLKVIESEMDEGLNKVSLLGISEQMAPENQFLSRDSISLCMDVLKDHSWSSSE